MKYISLSALLTVFCDVQFVFQSHEVEEQTKSMEELDFQKLEREINQDEEKENQSQELLREIAECQRISVTRKVVSWKRKPDY